MQDLPSQIHGVYLIWGLSSLPPESKNHPSGEANPARKSMARRWKPETFHGRTSYGFGEALESEELLVLHDDNHRHPTVTWRIIILRCIPLNKWDGWWHALIRWEAYIWQKSWPISRAFMCGWPYSSVGLWPRVLFGRIVTRRIPVPHQCRFVQIVGLPELRHQALVCSRSAKMFHTTGTDRLALCYSRIYRRVTRLLRKPIETNDTDSMARTPVPNFDKTIAVSSRTLKPVPLGDLSHLPWRVNWQLLRLRRVSQQDAGTILNLVPPNGRRTCLFLRLYSVQHKWRPHCTTVRILIGYFG